MSEQESVIFNLEVQLSELSMSELRKLELLAYRVIGLLRRMGLPENIDAGIAKLQQFIMIVRLAHTTIVAFQRASGPIGWAMALTSLAATSITVADTMRGY